MSRSGSWPARTSTARAARPPQTTINFVTCHDGFTLNDLVSYSSKHNEANGEDGRDGSDDNRSWGCGAEGPTDDPEVEALAVAPGPQPAGAGAAVDGRADAAHGRRGAADAGWQQQRLLPRRRDAWFDWADLERHADVLPTPAASSRPAAGSRSCWATPGDEPREHARAGRASSWAGSRLGQPDLGADSRSPRADAAGRGVPSTSSAMRGGSRSISSCRRASEASRWLATDPGHDASRARTSLVDLRRRPARGGRHLSGRAAVRGRAWSGR